MTRIAPCLWFDTKAEEAAEFYCSVFPNSRILSVSRYGPEFEVPRPKVPDGTALLVEFELDNRRFQALNGGPDFAFNEAISLSIEVDDQEDLDHYWTSLAMTGGSEGPCGWLKDKYGVSWQVVPKKMQHWMTSGDRPAIGRLMAAMLRMGKLDIEALESAYKNA